MPNMTDRRVFRIYRDNPAELPASAAHSHTHASVRLVAQFARPAALATQPSQRTGSSGLRLDFDADTVFDTIGLPEWARLAGGPGERRALRAYKRGWYASIAGDDLHIENTECRAAG